MQYRYVEIDEYGSPETLTVKSDNLAPPASDEVRVRHTAIGFNFIDTYQRQGRYPIPLPGRLGFEAAGVVETVGSGVQDFQIGDRIAYMNAGNGAYADYRNVPADKLVTLPDTISDEAAASLFFKGMTTQYLIRKTFPVKSGDLLLVHAAAGGVGQILTRWATALGAIVIGTTGSPAKRDMALEAGCKEVIDLNNPEWTEHFLHVTNGRKADVVYDSVGKDTLIPSLDCIAPLGLIISYGSASGPAPAIELSLLNSKGSLTLACPSIFTHNANIDDFRTNAADVFDAIAKGYVAVNIGARFALDDIVDAHKAAEARSYTGAMVIIP